MNKRVAKLYSGLFSKMKNNRRKRKEERKRRRKKKNSATVIKSVKHKIYYQFIIQELAPPDIIPATVNINVRDFNPASNKQMICANHGTDLKCGDCSGKVEDKILFQELSALDLGDAWLLVKKSAGNREEDNQVNVLFVNLNLPVL